MNNDQRIHQALPESVEIAEPPTLNMADFRTGAGTAAAMRPRSLEETGLSELYLADLISKHLSERGVLDLGELTRCTALPGGLIEQVTAFLREQGRAEVRGAAQGGLLRFALTERGRAAAMEALGRDGYVGPAPVPLNQYTSLVAHQTLSARSLNREQVHLAFRDVAIRPEVLDQLGPAIHSGRSIFIYGDAGTGKTFIARKLARLMSGDVLIPHAVLVADKAVRLFDAGAHEPVSGSPPETSLFLDQGHDPRYVLCKRPMVIVGGELTMDMLEVQYDTATRIHHAPAQWRANNGMLIIDDLGRQRMRPDELFNRWIVPMEESQDFLSLRSGQHFQVPFDVALVFSSNRHPLELADPAFLRRIGYKIRFDALTADEYRGIWHQECERQGFEAEPGLVEFMLDDLHGGTGVPLLPCHPRDLIGLATDYLSYMSQQTLTREALTEAWQNYFVDAGMTGRERES